ncbi:MAG: PQQ-binding-like beta-propeller repeat protein, partial [Nitrososphaera sp.]
NHRSRIHSSVLRILVTDEQYQRRSGQVMQACRKDTIVFKGRVYIGNGNGRFYALDAKTGALLWQFPPASNPPLVSQFTCNPSSLGIASSATIARIRAPHHRSVNAVIFGAPDPSIELGLGSGRLFALNTETGAVIWKSDPIASLTGLTGSTAELHEQIGYSSPLVFKGRVYIGVANHCDNPIQRGKVVAVRLNTGVIDGTFSFFGSGPPRGGGVWSSVAGFDTGVYVTTGNTNIGGPEPPDNHGLSLLRLNADTGSIIWKHQPVPFELDGDPDWAAGATVMRSSCGTLVTSTQKDGWTYAVMELLADSDNSFS